MNARIFSPTQFLTLVVIFITFSSASILLTGCAGAEEVQEETPMEESPPEMTIDPMQKMVDELRAENTTLRAQVNRLEQDKRNLTAQVAEFETKLAEARTREVAPPPPTPRRTASSNMEYDNALSLFNQKNYQEALSVWMGLLNTGAPEGLESNCHYWIGECYYGMGQYRDALSHFEHVFGYARTTKKDDAQLKIALCYERMGDRARAKQEYQKLIDQYPASPYVSRAKDRLLRL